MSGDSAGATAAAIEAALTSLELGFERPRPGAFLVRLEGQHKLATMTWLVAGEHSLGVEAFFCRRPDENHEAFYRFLLERNGRMYGVHFTLDPVGDVYLTGRLPLCAVSADPRSGGSGPGGSSAARAWPTCRRSPASPTPRRTRRRDPYRLAPVLPIGLAVLRVH